MPKGKPFPKGSSPNPGGRPKELASVRDKIREHGGELIDLLFDLARNAENETTRVTAIRDLLDRGFGKPSQPVEGTEDGQPIRLVIGWEEEPEAA